MIEFYEKIVFYVSDETIIESPTELFAIFEEAYKARNKSLSRISN